MTSLSSNKFWFTIKYAIENYFLFFLRIHSQFFKKKGFLFVVFALVGSFITRSRISEKENIFKDT